MGLLSEFVVDGTWAQAGSLTSSNISKPIPLLDFLLLTALGRGGIEVVYVIAVTSLACQGADTYPHPPSGKQTTTKVVSSLPTS